MPAGIDEKQVCIEPSTVGEFGQDRVFHGHGHGQAAGCVLGGPFGNGFSGGVIKLIRPLVHQLLVARGYLGVQRHSIARAFRGDAGVAVVLATVQQVRRWGHAVTH